jgi:hypothetical protein
VSQISDELLLLSGHIETEAKYLSEPKIEGIIDSLAKAISIIGKSSSQSWFGYHSRIYYRDFEPPPVEAHFSREWGWTEAFSNETYGDWCEYA